MTDKTDRAARIVAEDAPEPPIRFHIEDALAFVIFWALAIIVFLQFFTRYVLNDSYAWTEEIARYLLMVVTFIGGAVAMRRGTHISVEFAHHFLPGGAVRVLNFVIDLVVVGFVGLLCWFAIAIAQRMNIQTMTVLPVPMSTVYAGVGVGCFLMLFRAIQRWWQAMRRGWRPDPDRADLLID